MTEGGGRGGVYGSWQSLRTFPEGKVGSDTLFIWCCMFPSELSVECLQSNGRCLETVGRLIKVQGSSERLFVQGYFDDAWFKDF